MTDVVEVSPANASDAFQLAQSIAKGGASDGFVVDSADVELSTRNAGLSTANGEFAEVSVSGGDITIADGEAFVGGTWLARDVNTTVSVPGSYSGSLTVSVGWDAESADTVIVDHGQSGTAFTTYDKRIPLYEYTVTSGTVDGSGTDVRDIGQRLASPNLEATGAGSIFDAFAMDGANDLADASGIGDKAGEVFRYITAGGSDLGYGLVEVDGKFHVTYNAHWDSGTSTWERGTTGFAAKLSLGGTGGSAESTLSVAPSGSGTITWLSLAMNGDGTVDVGGTQLYDGSEVPQAILGGAASSLGTYPIPAADIDDGPGSGLDADTVDGVEAASIASDWTEIDTATFSGGTGVDYDSGVLGTTYDRYRLTVYREDDASTDLTDYLSLRLNGNGTSNYNYDYFDAFNNQFTSNDNESSFGKVFGLRTKNGALAVQEVEVICPTAIGTINRQYPAISTTVEGVSKNTDYIVSGSFTVSVSAVDRLEVFNDGLNGNGKVRLRGRDILA